MGTSDVLVAMNKYSEKALIWLRFLSIIVGMSGQQEPEPASNIHSQKQRKLKHVCLLIFSLLLFFLYSPGLKLGEWCHPQQAQSRPFPT